MGNVDNWVKLGRPWMAQMREVVKVVHVRIFSEMGIAIQMMSHIIHEDLDLLANKHYTHYPLTEKFKKIHCVHPQNLQDEHEN